MRLALRTAAVATALAASLASTPAMAGPIQAEDATTPDAGWQLLARAVEASDAALRRLGGSVATTATARNTYRYLDEVGPGGRYLRSSSWEPGNEDASTPDDVSWFALDSEGAWEYSRYRLEARVPTIPARGWSTQRRRDSTIPVPRTLSTVIGTPQPTNVTSVTGDPPASVITWIAPGSAGDPALGTQYTATVVQVAGVEPLLRSYTSQPVTPYYGNEQSTTEFTYGGEVVSRPRGWANAVPADYVDRAREAISNTRNVQDAVQEAIAIGRQAARTDPPRAVVRRLVAFLDKRASDYPQLDRSSTSIRSYGAAVRVVDANRYTGRRTVWTLTPSRDGRLLVDESSARIRVAPLPASQRAIACTADAEVTATKACRKQ